MKINVYKSKYFPPKKISATLLEFFEPFILEIDKNTTVNQIQSGMKIAVTVWNAISMDKWNDGNNFEKSLRSNMAKMENAEKNILVRFIDRKKKYFSNDLRAIGDFSVSFVDGNLNVKAEARLDNKFIQRG